jgi:hypothetical protein
MKNTRRQSRTLIAATLFSDITPVIDAFDPSSAVKILSDEGGPGGKPSDATALSSKEVGGT